MILYLAYQNSGYSSTNGDCDTNTYFQFHEIGIILYRKQGKNESPDCTRRTVNCACESG